MGVKTIGTKITPRVTNFFPSFLTGEFILPALTCKQSPVFALISVLRRAVLQSGLCGKVMLIPRSPQMNEARRP